MTLKEIDKRIRNLAMVLGFSNPDSIPSEEYQDELAELHEQKKTLIEEAGGEDG